MDYLAVIKRVMNEHKIIIDRLKLVGESIGDREAVLDLEKVKADFVGNFQSTASEKRDELERTLTSLDAGLRKHYEFEEGELPPLLGEWLTEALKLDHKQLLAEVEQVLSIIRSVKLEGLNREEQLNEEAVMYGLINRIRRQKEDHLRKEEAMLGMLQKILEEKSESATTVKFGCQGLDREL